MILIYDVNNWVRVKLEEASPAPIKSFFCEVITQSVNNTQIFVSDGKYGNSLRKGMHPTYKAKRKAADSSIYAGITFFKELLVDAPKNVLRAEKQGWEADDLIANLVTTFKNAGMKDVQIISTDKDYTQLGVPTLATPKTEAKWVRLYKTLVGDSSDNIPGLKGFGEKSWEKLSPEIRNRLCVGFDTQLWPKDICSWLEVKNFPLEELNLYWKIIGFFETKVDLLPGSGKVQEALLKIKHFEGF